ncbi:heterodisulfide reductase-related iron-sulfur binding cluster [Candidatus Berkiella aquae]|uniref:Glycolate oxidase iron-sulfur subunit n=1 Tax=Candidatus Berkiella aquae TaxID=295108 RepID=A0A0Q9YX09_9GAMM|nr:(Fe-S)-binding protein [Candidatus Berkiella aquae]MCS5710748.1 (Fe-S)-binding protein [Candidatus Berkiella aquae]
MNIKAQVNRLASQCVKCALCLPHCPTYELTEDENESPRGRIALFQAYANEQLPLDEHGKKHLDQCLGCRACERVCPAHVEYGHLLTLGRTMLNASAEAKHLTPTPFGTRFLAWVVKHPRWQRTLQYLLWLTEKSGLRTLGSRLKLPSLLGLSTLDRLLPTIPKPLTWQSSYEAIGPKQGSIFLFTGCMSNWCEQETIAASIYVLRHLGYEVHLPPNQTCCSAMALHAGDLDGALSLAKENLQVFLPHLPQMDAIVTIATGCNAVLSEYDINFSSITSNEDFATFSHKVIDIVNFVQAAKWPDTVVPKSLPGTVLLHTPCTLRNVIKTPFAPLQMLTRIPELVCQAIKSPYCCGAAGTYMLEHADIAKPLLKHLLSELDDIQANYIATSNVGCALHIQQQMRESNSAIRVIHPITLLARALGF